MLCPNLDDTILSKLFYGYTFPYLNKLCLSKCKITQLEKKLFDNRFPMLKALLVCENKEIRKIDDDAFSNLKELDYLILKDNSIESIEKCHFSNLTKLIALILDGNPLKNIKEEYVFSGLKNLRNLGLNKTQLTSLSPNSLAGLRNLERLSLKDNNFIKFDFDILGRMRRIKMIYLSGNPIINKDIITYRLENGGNVLIIYS